MNSIRHVTVHEVNKLVEHIVRVESKRLNR